MLKVEALEGGPPYFYNWNPQFSLSDPSIKDPIAYPTQTTNYTVSVSDSTGCPAIVDSVMVTVSPKPDASFIPSPFKGCEPLRVLFQDQSGPNIADWLWDFGDGKTSTDSSPHHTYSAGYYSIGLFVTTDDGCKDSLKMANVISVYPQPKANFDATPPVTNIDNPTISFTDRTNNSQFWFWDFGDNIPGDTSSLQNPSYTYSDEGGYTVMLIAYNQHGCADTAYKDVRVIIDEITIPNVITPNGDGYNDVFHIENIEKLEASTLLIYNRWGKKVYEANNYRNDWDGDNLADGVYFYVLKYDTFFESREASGTVTIMRKR
jgi:gliding motility-associated-like protein